MPADGATVVIGFGEALSAPEVTWSLVDAGHTVIAFSRRNRKCPLRHSRHARICDVTAPETDWQSARDELQALLESLPHTARVVVVPLDDASLWLCGRLPPSEFWTIIGSSRLEPALAIDKWRQISHARTAGFYVPDSALVVSDADRARATSPFPIILRAANAISVSGRKLTKGKNWICSDQSEFARAMAEWNPGMPLLLQPYLKGTGEGIFGLATPSGVMGWTAHRRLRMMNPHGSGSSACESSSVSGEIQAAAERFIAETGWLGLFMIELLRDLAGKVWFVEFNGRPWGSMALSRQQGLEFPAWAVLSAMSPSAKLPIPPDAFPKRLACRNVGRELMHLLFILRGPKSKALDSWPSFWRTACQIVSVRHGDRLYNWRSDDRAVFFTDCWYTVMANFHRQRLVR